MKGVKRNDLLKHKKLWSGCTRCSIASRRKVFYRGSVPCRYLFIGEAPGPSESVTGKPFTGTSGQVLNSLFKDAKVTNYGITNILACFPSRESNPGRFREPSEEEVHNCSERLEDLIETVKPDFYISLGKIAKRYPVSGMKWHLSLDHPAFIARQGGLGSIEYKRNKHILRKFINNAEKVTTTVQ